MLKDINKDVVIPSSSSSSSSPSLSSFSFSPLPLLLLPLPLLLLLLLLLQVCLAWPVASFPAARVGLQRCIQTSLGVKPGDGVTIYPVTGPLLQAQEVVLSPR